MTRKNNTMRVVRSSSAKSTTIKSNGNSIPSNINTKYKVTSTKSKTKTS